jgi:glycosyltransferase involved in cell wall biosynthesis
VTQFGFLSTYPPTRCGLATFTRSLASALVRPGDPAASIVRVLDEPEQRPVAVLGAPTAITAELIGGVPATRITAARALNASDVVIVQHEYGIYGGPDGDEVLELLEKVGSPCIVVLHTVLPRPTASQRRVLDAVGALASAVVVMTDGARDTLRSTYGIPMTKVSVIPHGAPVRPPVPIPVEHARRRILTWGLISPGKGIEWGVRAMAHLSDLGLDVEYVVAGQTHPKVLATAGEAYRESLTALVAQLGLEAAVSLDGRYLDDDELTELMTSADVVLLPYDSRDQVTSGVLAEAVAAGIPVVATGFPHATELLAGGAGAIAAHEDPESMAEALRTILTASDVAQRMHEAALRDAQTTSWPVVAEQYRVLAAELIAAQAA